MWVPHTSKFRGLVPHTREASGTTVAASLADVDDHQPSSKQYALVQRQVKISVIVPSLKQGCTNLDDQQLVCRRAKLVVITDEKGQGLLLVADM